MTAVTTRPNGRALTRDDLDAMPDDGHRYELLDGALIVTPAPSTGHQSVLAQLFLLIHAAAPDELKGALRPARTSRASWRGSWAATTTSRQAARPAATCWSWIGRSPFGSARPS